MHDYWIGRELGTGARSTVYAVKRKTDGKVFAAKYVPVRAAEDLRIVKHLENEHRVLRQVHETPGDGASLIVAPVEFKKVRRLFRIAAAYLVMEYVEGFSLAGHRDFNIKQTLRILQQVCQAMVHVHKAGYVHADFKPDNIMVDGEQKVKLIDFGFAAPIGRKLSGFKGTWGYVAPEQLGGVITDRTDVFNLGAAMYWVLTGRKMPAMMPQEHESRGFLPDETVELVPPSILNEDVPQELSDMVVRCCSLREHLRPTVSQVEAFLKNLLLRMEITG